MHGYMHACLVKNEGALETKVRTYIQTRRKNQDLGVKANDK